MEDCKINRLNSPLQNKRKQRKINCWIHYDITQYIITTQNSQLSLHTSVMWSVGCLCPNVFHVALLFWSLVALVVAVCSTLLVQQMSEDAALLVLGSKTRVNPLVPWARLAISHHRSLSVVGHSIWDHQSGRLSRALYSWSTKQGFTGRSSLCSSVVSGWNAS